MLVRPLLCLSAILVAGCATTEPQYVPPVQADASSSAQAIGSRVHRTWPIDDEVTWVLAVNGARTGKASIRGNRGSYAQPIRLAAGQQVLTVVFSQGILATTASFLVTLRPGQTVVAKSQTKDSTYLEKAAGKDYVLLWLEDQATGQVVSEQARGYISY
jgi:hypothetical protein